MSSRKAPLGVRIISWYFIIGSLISLIVMPFMLNNTQFRDTYHAMNASPETAVAVSVVGAIICLAAGIAMLRRRAWGRLVLLLYLPATLLYTLWMYNFLLQWITIFPAIICAVVFFLLTRRNASDYFSGKAVAEPEPARRGKYSTAVVQHSLPRRAAGIVLLVLSGFFFYIVTMSLASLPALGAASWRIVAWFGLPALALLFAGNWLRNIARWKIPSGVVFLSCGALLLLVGSALLMQTPLPGRDSKSAPQATIDAEQLKRTGRRLATASLPVILLGVGLIVWQRREDR